MPFDHSLYALSCAPTGVAEFVKNASRALIVLTLRLRIAGGSCTYCSQGQRDGDRDAQKGHAQCKLVNKVTRESDSKFDLELHFDVQGVLCCCLTIQS
jgi:hypothetical protein